MVSIGTASKRPHDKILRHYAGTISTPASIGTKTYGWGFINTTIQVATTIKGLRWNFEISMPQTGEANEAEVVQIEWFIVVVKAGQTASDIVDGNFQSVDGLSTNSATPVATQFKSVYQPEENCIIAGTGFVTRYERFCDHGQTKGMRKLMPGDNLALGISVRGDGTVATPVYWVAGLQYVYLF